MDVQRLIDAAKAVRDHVAHADVLFEPVSVFVDVAHYQAERERVEKARESLDELCSAIAELEADSQCTPRSV